MQVRSEMTLFKEESQGPSNECKRRDVKALIELVRRVVVVSQIGWRQIFQANCELRLPRLLQRLSSCEETFVFKDVRNS